MVGIVMLEVVFEIVLARTLFLAVLVSAAAEGCPSHLTVQRRWAGLAGRGTAVPLPRATQEDW